MFKKLSKSSICLHCGQNLEEIGEEDNYITNERKKFLVCRNCGFERIERSVFKK